MDCPLDNIYDDMDLADICPFDPVNSSEQLYTDAEHETDEPQHPEPVNTQKINLKPFKFYESRMRQAIDSYNGQETVSFEARYYNDRIYFTAPILDHNYGAKAPKLYGWANIVTPSVHTDDLFFLLVSADGKGVTCQPTITRGGLVSILMVYTTGNTPRHNPESFIILSELVMLPFIPFDVPEHVSCFSLQEEPCDPIVEKLTRMAGWGTFTQENGGIVIHAHNLFWKIQRVYSLGKRRLTYYSAAFIADPQGCDVSPGTRWLTPNNITFDSGAFKFSMNLDSLSITKHCYPRVVGIVSTTCCDPPEDYKSPFVFPKSVKFRIVIPELPSPWQIVFTRNPKLFLSGDSLNMNTRLLNEPNLKTITVHAPYDIYFVDSGRRCVRYDICYTSPNGMFIVSSPNNQSAHAFHTAMDLWKRDTPLKVTLWSNNDHLVVPHGSPIATLYYVRCRDGTLPVLSDTATFRMRRDADEQKYFLGGFMLPKENFIQSDTQPQ
ncbi:GP31 [Caviid betaherpesvirus 2]|uniref:GP31 n=2 Tax=Caviid betaherpesvirus 2 TaxID=33706 RepID=U6H6B6_9BETA|nr:GP31 [Caviid betaherpesvirus 2]AGE11509.1 GP31 [Caviid betaherpesvirus 2]AIL83897.1 GP31 [BAC cloning vector GPN13BACdenovo_preserved(MM)]BAJ78499.1 GP31 [Caviid betaherpesvirus 2]CDI95375.1 GP31 [Caviid herpesvirus 2 str. CIDMTR]